MELMKLIIFFFFFSIFYFQIKFIFVGTFLDFKEYEVMPHTHKGIRMRNALMLLFSKTLHFFYFLLFIRYIFFSFSTSYLCWLEYIDCVFQPKVFCHWVLFFFLPFLHFQSIYFISYEKSNE